MENNFKKIFIFTGFTILFILVGYSFSFLLLFALVPIILLLNNALSRNKSVLNWSIPLFLSFFAANIVISYIHNKPINIGIVIYPLGLSLVTSLYWIVNRNIKNSFGLFTLLIFWLAYDYLVLLLMPDYSQYFIFMPLEKSAEIITSSTGFMGTTFWGVCSNILITMVLFDPSTNNGIKLRWLSLTYVLILITAPYLISVIWQSNIDGITWQQMFDAYTNSQNENSTYPSNGEWLGRTSAWVAVLLVIYGLVKLKIKK